MLTPAMAQEVWKSPERPSIEKRPGRCANTVSIPGLTTRSWRGAPGFSRGEEVKPQQPLVMQPAPIDAVAHSAPRRCAPMPRSPGLRAMPAPLRFTATGQLMHGSESSEVGMRICAEPGCPAVVQSGRCPAHRRYSPTTQRSAAERKRRSKAVAEWVSANGWICPGWDRPPHPSHDLTAAHRIPVAGGGADSPLTCLCRACNSRQGLATS